MRLEFNVTVEINLYFEDHENPDVVFEYVSDLIELKKVMSDEFLEKKRTKYNAKKATVGKLEFVSLRDESEGLVCRDNRIFLSIDDLGVRAIVKEEAFNKNKKRV